MKKKYLTGLLVLSLAGLLLMGCGGNNEDSSSSSKSQESSAPVLNEGDLTYLKGTFFGKEGTLTLTKDKLELSGEEPFSLVPTSVEMVRTTYKVGDAIEEVEVPGVYFDASFNKGESYRFYADSEDDGYLHLEKKEGDEYKDVALFQPDISAYSGPLSFDGSGDASNIYDVLDGDFDFERGVYPLGRMGNGFWSQEQYWYAKAHLRTDKEGGALYTVEFFDGDDYSWGEKELTIQEGKVVLLEEGNPSDMSDAGAFRSLSLFDGEKEIALTSDPKTKSITFGEENGVYETGLDEKGFYLKATLSEKEKKFRLRHRSMIVEEGEKETVYAYNDVTPLLGEFTDKKDVFKFVEKEEGGYLLTWNGQEISFDFALVNKRKGLSFKVGSDSYLAAPDKENSSVYISKNGTVSYFLNGLLYDSLFSDTFVAKDKGHEFSVLVSSDFSYIFQGKTGKATYSYWHGDKFPSLLLEDGETLSIKQQESGYFLFNDGKEEINLYSKTILDKAYGEYSSDGENALSFDSFALTMDGEKYAYEFKPYYNENLGVYYFAIDSELGYFESNLEGCLYTSKQSFVKKDLFASIAGVYSGYGECGVENITFTKEGKLLMDLVNEAGDGLNKDVETAYNIYTRAGGDGDKAFLTFLNKGLSIFIYFYDDYVKIAGQSYFKESITLSWGVYLDEAKEHLLYVKDNVLFMDGSALTIKESKDVDGLRLLSTSAGLLSFTKLDDGGYQALLDGKKFTRALSFEDYRKFVGTYEVNSTKVVVEKTPLSYKVSIGENASDVFASSTFLLKDGKVALKIPNLLDNYYLSLDGDKVTASYEAGSLPPPPPLPTL